MKPGFRTLLIGCLAALVASTTSATIVSGSLTFTATGFGAGAPSDPVTGTVHYSFDNSATFFGASDGSTQNGAPVSVSFSALSLPGGWTPVLTYILSGNIGPVPVADLMSIGHVLNGTQTLAGTDDWRLAIDSVSSGPTFREFTYTQAGDANVYQSFTGAVPDVGTGAQLALGMMSLLALWRRGKQRMSSAR
jgi:hypothetical protein